MPVRVEDAKRPAHDPVLPDALTAGTLLLAELNQSGLLGKLGSVFKVSRRGGYSGLPLVAFALAYLAGDQGLGIRPYWTTFKSALNRVAVVAGCRSLPSSGSVSRAMVKLTPESVAVFSDAALSMMDGFARLLGQESVAHCDSHGKDWHVLDIDPSVQAFRLRDLVEGDDYPDPERQAPGVPGYVGQYRGEVRIRHVAMCHAGSGLWLAYRVSDDNPPVPSEFFGPIVEQSAQVMVSAGICRERIVVRGDGEFGSAGVIRAFLDRSVQVLVRIGRYNLLARPEVAAALQTAVWCRVKAGCVHVREATDLGFVMLHPSAKSADAGQPGVSVRVVIARRWVGDSKVAYGKVRDGYQYELFATSLLAEDFSAADIVHLYAGRSVIENRFAQEDRELALGRTFSYHAPGQAWFTTVGLFLWNYWTCSGFLQSPPPARPAPMPRQELPALPDPRPVDFVSMPTEPTSSDDPLEPHAAAPEAAAIPEAAVTDAIPEAAVTDAVAPVVTGPSGVSTDPFPGAGSNELAQMVTILSSAFRDTLQTPGWSILPNASIRCPNDQRLFPFSVANAGNHRPKRQVIIRTDVAACDGCPIRSQCFSSTRPNMYKQISRSVSPIDAAEMVAFLAKHPPTRKMRQIRPAPPRPTRRKDARPPPEAPPAEPHFRPIASSGLGPWELSPPTYAPAAARQLARQQYVAVRVEVRIGRGAATPAAPSSSGPRRLRRTWTERDDRWRTEASARVIRHLSGQFQPKHQRK